MCSKRSAKQQNRCWTCHTSVGCVCADALHTRPRPAAATPPNKSPSQTTLLQQPRSTQHSTLNQQPATSATGRSPSAAVLPCRGGLRGLHAYCIVFLCHTLSGAVATPCAGWHHTHQLLVCCATLAPEAQSVTFGQSSNITVARTVNRWCRKVGHRAPATAHPALAAIKGVINSP